MTWITDKKKKKINLLRLDEAQTLMSHVFILIIIYSFIIL